VGSEREEQKLQKFSGQGLKDQQKRKEMAQRRQGNENGVGKQSKQRLGK
jgi:hypothetical protein